VRLKNTALSVMMTCSMVLVAQNGPTVPPADDPPLIVNSGWQQFSWGGPGTPFDNQGAFTLTAGVGTVLKVTDAFCKGDQFRVFDNGVQIFDTSLVPVDLACSVSIGDPDVAFADPTYSKGSIALASGVHSITIQTIINPFLSGAAFIRADGPPTDAYQINYLPAAGAGIAGGYIDISNAGALGADAFGPLAGTTGRICVNVYTFTADEQESECCSCLVTPNALVHLTAADLIGNPGNGVTPTLGLVVKLLATIPGPGVNTQGTFTSSACNAAQTFTAANLAPGMTAWATKFHANATASPATVRSLTETQFSQQTLSAGELTKLTNLCQFLSGNQSGAGLCKSCTLGGLGAGKR